MLGFWLTFLKWWELPVKSGWKSLDFCTRWRINELGAKSEFTLLVCLSQGKEAEAEVFYGSLFSGGERWCIRSVELTRTLCDLFNKGDERLQARDWPFIPCNFHTPSEIWTSSSICTMKPWKQKHNTGPHTLCYLWSAGPWLLYLPCFILWRHPQLSWTANGHRHGSFLCS